MASVRQRQAPRKYKPVAPVQPATRMSPLLVEMDEACEKCGYLKCTTCKSAYKFPVLQICNGQVLPVLPESDDVPDQSDREKCDRCNHDFFSGVVKALIRKTGMCVLCNEEVDRLQKEHEQSGDGFGCKFCDSLPIAPGENVLLVEMDVASEAYCVGCHRIWRPTRQSDRGRGKCYECLSRAHDEARERIKAKAEPAADLCRKRISDFDAFITQYTGQVVERLSREELLQMYPLPKGR
jgi:hypothetical protein